MMPLDEKKVDQMCRLFDSGHTATVLAEMFRISPRSVRRYLVARGVYQESAAGTRTPDATIRRIHADYMADPLASIPAVARRHGLTVARVKEGFRRLGLKGKPCGGNNRSGKTIARSQEALDAMQAVHAAALRKERAEARRLREREIRRREEARAEAAAIGWTIPGPPPW